jgi:hypothetical protein
MRVLFAGPPPLEQIVVRASLADPADRDNLLKQFAGCVLTTVGAGQEFPQPAPRTTSEALCAACNLLGENRRMADHDPHAPVPDPCEECGASTIYGSGLFVNREPGDSEDTYLCPICQSQDDAEWHDEAYADGDRCSHCDKVPSVPYAMWEESATCACEDEADDGEWCLCAGRQNLVDGLCARCRAGQHVFEADLPLSADHPSRL